MLKKRGGLFASATRELPLFPLSGIVFPGGRMSLKVFEQRYKAKGAAEVMQQTGDERQQKTEQATR